MEYQKRLIRQSNYWYNDGLKKARIRDLSGAIASLRRSLQYNRANVQARNLLGLVYYGRGEVSEALVEWIISKSFKAHENIAEYYIRKVQDASGQLEVINDAVKKYNQSITHCFQGNEDVAVIELRKAVAAHPSFVKAFQLLGLIYLHTGQPAKAKQMLRRAQRLDTTDPLTLRYMHELKLFGNGKSAGQREEKEKTVTYNVGNETVIQPAASMLKDMPPSVTIMNLLIGILIGAAFVWFLVVPTVNAAKSSNVTRTAAAYSQEIAAQKAQVSALKTQIEEYRAAGDETEAAKALAASAQESYEALIAVSDQYASGDYSYADMAEGLKKVNSAVLGETGSAEYTKLAGKIYPSVCGRLYSTAENCHDNEDTAGEIAALEEILTMTEGYEDGDALLALADAYLASGNTEKANEKYNRVIELFPDSDKAELANGGLAGTPAGIFGRGSSSDSYDSDDSYSDDSGDDSYDDSGDDSYEE